MKKLSFISALIFFMGSTIISNAQENQTKKFFVGYELLEMSMNEFKYFAGEVGYRFNPKHQLSLSIGEIDMTERHLSSNEAAAVDGDNVEGYFRIYELTYSRFFGKRKLWHYGANVGYVYDEYDHLISDNEIKNHTLTAGVNFGFQKMDIFKIKHLYLRVLIPIRYNFNSIPEQEWGETTIREHKFVPNTWLFLGYRF